jgi:hypothetical protein
VNILLLFFNLGLSAMKTQTSQCFNRGICHEAYESWTNNVTVPQIWDNKLRPPSHATCCNLAQWGFLTIYDDQGAFVLGLCISLLLTVFDEVCFQLAGCGCGAIQVRPPSPLRGMIAQ